MHDVIACTDTSGTRNGGYHCCLSCCDLHPCYIKSAWVLLMRVVCSNIVCCTKSNWVLLVHVGCRDVYVPDLCAGVHAAAARLVFSNNASKTFVLLCSAAQSLAESCCVWRWCPICHESLRSPGASAHHKRPGLKYVHSLFLYTHHLCSQFKALCSACLPLLTHKWQV